MLKKFGSLKRLREAPVEELCQTPGVGKEMASVIYEALHGGDR